MQVKAAEIESVLPLERCEESELIRRCQNGDKHAYEGLVKRHMKKAYFIALGLLGSSDNAMDLSQEAFVRAFKAIQRLDPQKSFFTWYYCILKNLCFNFLRDQKRHARPFSDVEEKSIQLATVDPISASHLAEQNETKRLVWRALNELKVQEREIIILKDFQDFSYKDISVLLHCPIGTVMSRLYNARKSLKTKLERWFDEQS